MKLAIIFIILTLAIFTYNVNAQVIDVNDLSLTDHNTSPIIDVANYAIKLNGLSGKITVTNSTGLDGFSQATWNIWVKQNSYVDFAPLYSKYAAEDGKRAYIIRISNNNSISVILSANGNTTEGDTSLTNRACGITDGEWTMITITYDGSKIIYYKNGVFCDEDQTSISRIHTSPVPLTVGNYQSVYLNGLVDEASIYNRNLSGEEVSYLYSISPHKKILIPVLAYHRFEQQANQLQTVTPQNFDLQMAYIKSKGFTTITVSDYNNWKNNNFNMPSKPVIITFDDGPISVYTEALPIMRRYGLKGTLNIVTNYANGIQGGVSYMHWPEINSLINEGWELQSHSLNHSDQLLFSQSQFRHQLNFSKQNILANTGKNTIAYTFPYSSANQTYVSICGEYYSLCFATSVDPTNPAYVDKNTNGKLYGGLKRINIYNNTDMQTFQNIFLRIMPPNVNPSPPTAYWKMNEGTGSVTYSVNSYKGQLSSGTSWVPVK